MRLQKAGLPAGLTAVECSAQLNVAPASAVRQRGTHLQAVAHKLYALPPAVAGGFDMIVDDGSHGPSHIFATLTALWPTIKPGGVYIVEDLGLHWWPNRGAKWTEYSLDAPAPLAVPLYQRLIHTINCLTTTMTPHYSEDYIAWCRKEQANSIFRWAVGRSCSCSHPILDSACGSCALLTIAAVRRA